MGAPVQIKEAKKLLESFLEKNQNVVKLETKSLVAPGDNYGSYLLDLEITLSDKQMLRLVAKMCPSNSFLKKMFCVLVTAKKEIEAYRSIFPALANFSQELDGINRITFAPKYYGSRMNLKLDSDEIDDDAVLLLENLKVSGYMLMDRMEGLNFEISNLLMHDLAVFHAVPIAFKLLRPKEFSSKILPHLQEVSTIQNISKETCNSLIDKIVETAQNLEKCKPLMKRFEAGIRNYGKDKKRFLNEKFATLSHNDLWINNALIRFENGDPVDCKILDFQFLSYGSPGKDIVFFLLTSVQTEVFYRHFDDFIQTYYESFINTLTDLKCDVMDFTLKNLKAEIEIAATTSEFFHTMYMLGAVFSPKGKTKSIDDWTEQDLIAGVAQSSKTYLRKFEEKTLQFAYMNWI